MKRGYEKPTVEELRGGGVEAACSKIYILYDENAKENDGKKFLEIGEEIRGKLTLIDGKSRFDDTDSITLYYDKLRQVMKDWNEPRPGEFINEYQEQPKKKDNFDLF
jgi:hypothetical protein